MAPPTASAFGLTAREKLPLTRVSGTWEFADARNIPVKTFVHRKEGV
jgi:hypothetical protein